MPSSSPTSAGLPHDRLGPHHEESTVVQVTELVLPDQGYITSDTLDTAVVLTQAEYNLLTPVPTTLYVIIG